MFWSQSESFWTTVGLCGWNVKLAACVLIERLITRRFEMMISTSTSTPPDPTRPDPTSPHRKWLLSSFCTLKSSRQSVLLLLLLFCFILFVSTCQENTTFQFKGTVQHHNLHLFRLMSARSWAFDRTTWSLSDIRFYFNYGLIFGLFSQIIDTFLVQKTMIKDDQTN